MEKMLVQHVVRPHVVITKTRDAKGKLIVREKKQVGRIGTFVGINIGNLVVKTGWSVVKFHAGDSFNADAGVAFATVKAVRQSGSPISEKAENKYGIARDYQIFQKRCSKFFKGSIVEGYDPELDFVEDHKVNDKEEALRKALRDLLPPNSKFLADGPIMGFGDGMTTPINLGNIRQSGDLSDIIKMIGKVTDMISKEAQTPASVAK